MNDFVSAAKSGNHKEQGWPNTGYGVSKVGIIAMTKILARQQYKDDGSSSSSNNSSNNKLMINSVDPGYCATDQNNNQGYVSAERGAQTPYLLATIQPPQAEEQLKFNGRHWYEEQEIEW